MKKTTNKAKGVGVCLAAIVFLLFAAGSASESGNTSSKPSKDSSEPAAETSVSSKTKAQEELTSISLLNIDGHPQLFGTKAEIEQTWNEYLNKDVLILNGSNSLENDFPLIRFNCFSVNNGETIKSNKIHNIYFRFENCAEYKEGISLITALKIVKTFLPLDIIDTYYSFSESGYLFSDGYLFDQKISEPSYDYIVEYHINDASIIDETLENGYSEWIYIDISTDGNGNVNEAQIWSSESYCSVDDWYYDFTQDIDDEDIIIHNNASEDKSTYIHDDELRIIYPRPSGIPALAKGSSGSEVGWLQSALNRAMDAGLEDTGVFDEATDTAVREFQSRCGLGVDGSVGPRTIAMLVEIVSGRKSMPEKVIVTDPPRVIVAPEPETEKPASVNTPSTNQSSSGQYVLNTSTMKIHTTTCRDLSKIDPENRMEYTGSIDDLIAQGYTTCGHCHPH